MRKKILVLILHALLIPSLGWAQGYFSGVSVVDRGFFDGEFYEYAQYEQGGWFGPFVHQNGNSYYADIDVFFKNVGAYCTYINPTEYVDLFGEGHVPYFQINIQYNPSFPSVNGSSATSGGNVYFQTPGTGEFLFGERMGKEISIPSGWYTPQGMYFRIEIIWTDRHIDDLSTVLGGGEHYFSSWIKVCSTLETPTPTFTPTRTNTPAYTPTFTPTGTPSNTPTRTFTPTYTPTKIKLPAPGLLVYWLGYQSNGTVDVRFQVYDAYNPGTYYHYAGCDFIQFKGHEYHYGIWNHDAAWSVNPINYYRDPDDHGAPINWRNVNPSLGAPVYVAISVQALANSSLYENSDITHIQEGPIPVPTSTFTKTFTPTNTPTNTTGVPPSITPTRTPTYTVTRTFTPTHTYTNTPTHSPSPTVNVPPTVTPSHTRTYTPTWTPTVPTPTYTFTSQPTNTPTVVIGPPTVTPSFTPTDTIPPTTPTWTFSPTKTFTPTWTPTLTWTPTYTWTPSFTPTYTPTASNTPTSTNTPTGAYTPPPTLTFTPSRTPTWTPTHTFTPTQSPTNTATPTPTITKTATITPLPTPRILPLETFGCTIVDGTSAYVGWSFYQETLFDGIENWALIEYKLNAGAWNFVGYYYEFGDLNLTETGFSYNDTVQFRGRNVEFDPPPFNRISSELTCELNFPTYTFTPTNTPTVTPTGTNTLTPTVSPTGTLPPTDTYTPTATFTYTPTNTATAAPTATVLPRGFGLFLHQRIWLTPTAFIREVSEGRGE